MLEKFRAKIIVSMTITYEVRIASSGFSKHTIDELKGQGKLTVLTSSYK